MEKKLILRGLLAGACAGLLAFVFARIFAEPQIQRAIDYESGREDAQHALDQAAGLGAGAGAGEHEIFSRTVQSWLGAGTGLVLFGMAMGALFAVAYAIAYGRVGVLGARALALRVALGGLLTVYLVPFLKYPANPPSIGHADTIKQRSTVYLIMVAACIVFGILSVWAGRTLRRRYSAWTSALLAGAVFLAAIGIVIAVLPSVGELGSNPQTFGRHATETPLPLRAPDGRIVYPGFPADVLFNFRLYSIGAQVVLWATLALIFGPLAERLLEPHRRGPRSRPVTPFAQPRAQSPQ